MAKEDDDLFDDITDDSEGEGEGEGEDGAEGGEGGKPPMPEGEGEGAPEGEDSEKALIERAAEHLREHGIDIDTSGIEDCEEFVEHLCTASATHAATKQKVEGELNAGGEAAPPAEEESPMMMSTLTNDPVARALGEQMEAQQRRTRLARIDRLEKAQVIKPGRAKKLRQQAGAVRLSLNRTTGKIARAPLDDILDALEDTPAAAKLSTRRGVKPVPTPPLSEADASEKEDPELVDILSGKRSSLAGKNGLVRDQ